MSSDGSSLVGGNCADGRTTAWRAASGCDLVYVDRFGRAVAAMAHHRWQISGMGPTWREVWTAPDVEELMADTGVEPSRYSLQVFMARASGRLWIASTRAPRSLCAGPRYFGMHGRSRESADHLGRLVAQAVGSFRYRTHRSPNVWQLARCVRTPDRRLAFARTAALRAELPWLVASGWISLKDNEIRRGETAKLDRQRRAAARRLLRGPTPSAGRPAEL